AVFAGNDVRLFPSNDSYVVGHLGPVGRTLWFLSSHPLMIVLLLVSAAAALAKLTTRAAARRAARRLGASLLLLMLIHPSFVRADPTPPVPTQELERRAQEWEAKGRMDKAVEIWEQLLRLDPQASTARAGLARCKAAAAQFDAERERALGE